MNFRIIISLLFFLFVDFSHSQEANKSVANDDKNKGSDAKRDSGYRPNSQVGSVFGSPSLEAHDGEAKAVHDSGESKERERSEVNPCYGDQPPTWCK